MDGQRDARRGGVANRLDVEVEAVRRQPRLQGEVGHHRLVGLVGDDELDAREERVLDAIWVGEHAELTNHLLKVAAGQRLDLRTVDGDVVVESGVGPDDRVHLGRWTARVGLHELDVRRLALGGGADHEGCCTVTEDHAGRANVADLVRELLDADDEHRALNLLEDSGRVGKAVGHPRTCRDDVAGRMGLEDSQLTGDPGRNGGNDPGARAGADQHSPDVLGSAARMGQSRRCGFEGNLLHASRGVAPLVDARLVKDLVRGHR